MSLDYAKVDMKLTGHNTVATFMHYVHTKDTPMRDAAELVANRLLVILKRKDFARWQAAEKLPDAVLCKAVQEMESGLIDADLGGSLYKKRVARPGGGKRGGYRTLLSARIGSRHVFLHGFPKSDKASITQDEKKALQFAGKVFLELSTEALSKALQANVLLEVHCEQDH